MHAKTPAGFENVPAEQSVQFEELEAPVEGWYMPPEQSTHICDPVLETNFPPAHGIQLTAPEDGWYWPEGQLVHGVRSPLNLPATQVEMQLAEPTADTSPGEHPAQMVDVVAPMADE